MKCPETDEQTLEDEFLFGWAAPRPVAASRTRPSPPLVWLLVGGVVTLWVAVVVQVVAEVIAR